MPIEKKPANPVPKGQRPGSRNPPYKVTDADSIETVAQKHAISVTALIHHNFATMDPAEINWYLRENVGCNKPTADGKNWRFSASAKPGLIYIPAANGGTPPLPPPPLPPTGGAVLNAAAIAARLAAVSRNLRDNEAQNIINGATPAQLKSLDAEAVLRLYEALRMLPPLIYSSLDQAAMKRLAGATQFQPVKTPDFGVSLVKSARPGTAVIQNELTPDLIRRIYAAEDGRLDWWERVGVDGETLGRGQLGQLAYTDVSSPKHFQAELEKCLTHVYISRIVNAPPDHTANESFRFDSAYKFQIPTQYSMVWRDPVLEDFVVAAYLAIRMENATKAGRSVKDSARFAVALYHGKRESIFEAQKKAKDDINWAPVEAELRKMGLNDWVDYVNEVVK